MSLYDVRGLFATDKEMARRRSLSREPQAALACESLIQRSSCAQSVTKSTGQRADELISVSLITATE